MTLPKGLPVSSVLLLTAAPLTWLIPNHYPPWTTAWSDGLALSCLAAALLLSIGRANVATPRAWLIVLTAALTSVVWQHSSGLIRFAGDAVMAGLYLLAFLLAIGAGTRLAVHGSSSGAICSMAGLCLLASVMSVGIALVQWTGAVSLGIFAADLPQGARPYANLAQANQFSSVVFLGLCSLAVWYEQQKRFGNWTLCITGLFLTLGLVMASSRTAWLQAGLTVFAAGALQRRTRCRLRLGWLLAWLLIFGLSSLAWPFVNDTLMLSGARAGSDLTREASRLTLWQALWAAVQERPWTGYGWQQVVMAQAASSDEFPTVQRHFEYAHNLVLDLLVWTGLPVGLALTAGMLWALADLVRRLSDGVSLWLTLSVVGLLVHSLLEYPHAYAYFLIPAGLALGAASQLSAVRSVQISLVLQAVLVTIFSATLAFVAVDYVAVEESHRQLRFESARIGTSQVTSTAPELKVLTQLQAFLEFARTPAVSGMGDRRLQQMEVVASRFAYPASLLRLALAQGLNGQPTQAESTLRRLCAMHPPMRCSEGRDAWQSLREQHPQLPPYPPG